MLPGIRTVSGSMSSDQSTVLMPWAKMSIRSVSEKTYVAEGPVSTIRVRSYGLRVQ